MIRTVVLITTLVLAAGCSKKPTEKADPTGSAVAPTKSGSAATAVGSGSAMAGGSGSATAAGSGSADGSATGSGSGSAAAAGGSPFDKLSHDDKVAFMKKTVMPAMRKAFQDFDSKEFAKFTCKTCHGKDPEKSKYEMPNPGLEKLDFAALKAGKQAPKMAAFMAKVVKPEMAKMLGDEEMTESNPKGFGCLHCHEMKK